MTTIQYRSGVPVARSLSRGAQCARAVSPAHAAWPARVGMLAVFLGVAWATGSVATAAPSPPRSPNDRIPSPASAALPSSRPAEATPAPSGRPPGKLADAEKQADAALATKEPSSPAVADQTSLRTQLPEMNLWEMTVQGGPIMIPIGLFSILVVALALERLIALRRSNILPRRLVDGLRSQVRRDSGLDPRQAAHFCQRYPSAAARVIRALLAHAGRPHGEIREAVQEASQREADRLTAPVRWLTLSASVAPMLGLLGTVQGMIQAFFITAHLPVGSNKAQFLASSIYVALVTTFGGLTVAIPAAVLAHLYNGRVLRLFRELDEVILGLEPQIRRFRRHQRAARSGPTPGPGLAMPEEDPPRQSRARASEVIQWLSTCMSGPRSNRFR